MTTDSPSGLKSLSLAWLCMALELASVVAGELDLEDDTGSQDHELSLRDWQPQSIPSGGSQPLELSLRDWGEPAAAHPPESAVFKEMPSNQVPS